MVNTFFPFESAAKSIASLDTRRLGKQRVEAYQILNILLDAYVISSHFGYSTLSIFSSECTPNIYNGLARKDWLKDTFKKYKTEPYRLKCLLSNPTRYFKCDKNTKKEEGYRIVTGGFSSHPMVIMWIGYERALKDYINLCIDEWVRRGFTNTMSKYPLDKDIPIEYPWWTQCLAVQYSHRSALLRKEKARHEPDWYSLNSEFTSLPKEWYTSGYCWIYNLSEEQLLSLQSGVLLSSSIVCDIIRNDDVLIYFVTQ
jgi:hypothetical protein